MQRHINKVLTNVKCDSSDNDKSAMLATIWPYRISLYVDLRNHKINEHFKIITQALAKGSSGRFAHGDERSGLKCLWA